MDKNLNSILQYIMNFIKKYQDRKTLKTSGEVKSRFRQTVDICTLKLTKPNTEYMVCGYVDCSAGYDGIMSCYLGVSDSADVAGPSTVQTYASGGGGCTTTRYVKTGTGPTTLSIKSYGYNNADYNLRGSIFAIEI